MSDSLRDQLMGLGFKPAPAPKPRQGQPPGQKQGRQAARQHDRKSAPGQGAGRAADRRPGGGPARARKGSREEMDLAKAYAIRAQKEKEERIEAERLKQEAARERREARARLAVLLEGKALNAADADIARHFDYGGKIKRVHVTADQLKALNAGELGVVQQDGRYLLVTAQVLDEAESVFAPAVALRVDPSAAPGDDPYADPQYQVPDDLVW